MISVVVIPAKAGRRYFTKVAGTRARRFGIQRLSSFKNPKTLDAGFRRHDKS